MILATLTQILAVTFTGYYQGTQHWTSVDDSFGVASFSYSELYGDLSDTSYGNSGYATCRSIIQSDNYVYDCDEIRVSLSIKDSQTDNVYELVDYFRFFVSNTNFVSDGFLEFNADITVDNFPLNLRVTPFIYSVVTRGGSFDYFVWGKTFDCLSSGTLLPNIDFSYLLTQNHGAIFLNLQLSLFDEFIADYNSGYTDGYNSGYDVGYDEGYNTGNQNGYTQGSFDGYANGNAIGQVTGYNNGYQAGLQESGGDYSFSGLFRAIIDTPIWFLNSLFNFDFFGTGGTFITMITSLLTALVIVTLIKKVF